MNYLSQNENEIKKKRIRHVHINEGNIKVIIKGSIVNSVWSRMFGIEFVVRIRVLDGNREDSTPHRLVGSNERIKICS